MTVLIDLFLIDQYISDAGITLEAFADTAGLSANTIYRARSGSIDIGSAEKIAKAAGLVLDDIISIDEKIKSQAKEIARILLCIAYLALVEFLRVIDKRYAAKNKEGTRNIDELEGVEGNDIDKHLADFFIERAKQTLDYIDSPFKTGGMHIWEEERVPERIPGTSGRVDFAFTGDSVDDSNMAETKLGGQGVFAVHHRQFGLMACVVIDYARKLLYSATPFGKTIITRISDLSQNIDPASPHSIPEGASLADEPTDRTTVRGAKINVFTGKSDRKKHVNEYLGKLLDMKIAWFPYGGARGPCLTADGTVDASVETYKGMRYLDAIPALLLVQQAGGVCLDPDTGRRIRLNQSKDLFDALDKGDMEKLANLRKKFIAAGNMRLARTIRNKINGK